MMTKNFFVPIGLALGLLACHESMLALLICSSGGDLLEKPIALLPSTKLIKEGFEFKYKTLEHIYENMVEYGKALGILPN